MRPVVVTFTAGSSAVSQPIPLDYIQNPFVVGVYADLQAGASVVGMSVEVTAADIFSPSFVAANAKWFTATDTNIVNKTADMYGKIDIPCRACRVVTSAGEGVVEVTVIQATTNP